MNVEENFINLIFIFLFIYEFSLLKPLVIHTRKQRIFRQTLILIVSLFSCQDFSLKVCESLYKHRAFLLHQIVFLNNNIVVSYRNQRILTCFPQFALAGTSYL